MRILQLFQLFQRRATPERTERIMQNHGFWKDCDDITPYRYSIWYHRDSPIEDEEIKEIQRELRGAKVVRELHKGYYPELGWYDIHCVRVTIPIRW